LAVHNLLVCALQRAVNLHLQSDSVRYTRVFYERQY
jgi:hypothetical protein